MEFCETHFNLLRDATKRAGIDDIVKLSLDEFDPLMYAHDRIVANVMNYTGLDLLLPDGNDAERCPLCFVASNHREKCIDPTCHVDSYDHWIDIAVTEAKEVKTLLLKNDTELRRKDKDGKLKGNTA